MSSNTVLAEYIWLDGKGIARSKTRVLQNIRDNSSPRSKPIPIQKFPEWNYDGSSTGQAEGKNSEVIIKPCALFIDPFRRSSHGNEHFLVLCDTYLPDNSPHPTNTRVGAIEKFNRGLEHKPMFGIEQEFFLMKNKYPVGWKEDDSRRLAVEPKKQGDYYCGTGANNAIGRECIEKAFDNCLYAGLSLTGMNAEVAPSQWELQVCATGIAASDQLYIMRYILSRTAEEYGWYVEFHPKPVSGDWNGSGCHTNFSTEAMRSDDGIEVIHDAISKLSQNHDYHMKNYGVDNDKRMTGQHETAEYSKFSYGVANRGASVRIPISTQRDGKGYFEDRRPSSNMDPYVVTSLLFETTTL